jgi:transcriptional regulator with XRE-family HTH domain
MPDFRESIREAMQSQCLSQAELARRAHVGQPRLSEYLAGRRDLTGDTLERVMEALAIRFVPQK